MTDVWEMEDGSLGYFGFQMPDVFGLCNPNCWRLLGQWSCVIKRTIISLKSDQSRDSATLAPSQMHARWGFDG